jgi:hypothetical protein
MQLDLPYLMRARSDRQCWFVWSFLCVAQYREENVAKRQIVERQMGC